MPTFDLQFDPAEIPALADRFGITDDAACEHAGQAAAERGWYERDEFLLVCAWKSPRSRPRVEANEAGAVKASTGRALGSPDEATRMTALLELDGVGVPTASTLLYFAYPADYPILDVRACESLGQKARPTVAFWLDYLEACRELALTNGVSVRTLDKALWQYSKEK
jgi:hypothetical protein